MNKPLAPHKSGLVLALRLIPNASENRITGLSEDAAGNCRLNLRVTAVPEKGKANLAMLKLLAKSLNIRRTDFHIIRGETDRNKTVLIDGDPGRLMHDLTLWLEEL